VGLHFAVSGRLLDRDVETTTDPILAARRTVNGLLVSVAGLIAVAVGNELVIAHPQSQVSMALSLVLFGGPSSWSSPFVTGCDFKLAPHAPAGLTAMPIDRPGLRCQYLRGSRTGVRPSTITRRSLPEIARNSATRNLTSPHDPPSAAPFTCSVARPFASGSLGSTALKNAYLDAGLECEGSTRLRVASREPGWEREGRRAAPRPCWRSTLR
jgi:hypothetical protein